MAAQVSLKQIFTNYTLFVDGVAYTGDVDQIELPKLAWKIEEYRGGGMDIPVEVKLGHEKIEMTFDLTSHSDTLLTNYGIAAGVTKVFQFYGVLVDVGGNETQVSIEVNGFIKALDQGTVKPGSKTTAKATVAIYYMKHQIGNVTVLEIDAMNMVFISNGVDVLANQRQLLGLA